MKILMIGDLHGRIEVLARIDQWAIRNSIDLVVQAGDFGLHWPGEECRLTKYFVDNVEGPTWLSCLGNHDNYDAFDRRSKLAKDIAWGVVPFNVMTSEESVEKVGARCYSLGRPFLISLKDDYETKIAFLGGAVSSDAHRRIQGKDWWSQEAPTYGQLSKLFDLLHDGVVDIMVTHDRPLMDPFKGEYESATNNLSRLPLNFAATSFREIIDRLPSKSKPWAWYYGHIHEIRETREAEICFRGTGYHGSGWYLEGDYVTPQYFNINAMTKNKVFSYVEPIPQGAW